MPEWNLVKAMFNGITFDTDLEEPREDPTIPGSILPSYAGVISTTETFGKRLQIDRLPGRPGARVTDRGRLEEGIRVRAVFWGPNYQARWFTFKNIALLRPGTGLLVHPVWGEIKCTFHRGTITSVAGKASSVLVDMIFVEDATDLQPLEQPELLVAQAQAEVEKTSLDQVVEMLKTVQSIARTVTDVRISVVTFTQGVFTYLNINAAGGRDVDTAEPVVTCAELFPLYAAGAAAESAQNDEIVARRSAT